MGRKVPITIMLNIVIIRSSIIVRTYFHNAIIIIILFMVTHDWPACEVTGCCIKSVLSPVLWTCPMWSFASVLVCSQLYLF